MVVDYVARVEVRHVGAPDVIGTVEAIETGAINEHGTGNTGERWAAADAIDEALDEAVRAFAPRIHTPRRPTLIVEVPPADAGNLMRKLETLQRLYPELSVAQVQALADSRERFLVVEPGAPRDARARARGSAGCPGRPDRREPRGAGARRRPRRQAAGRRRSRRPALHPFDVTPAPARRARQGVLWQVSADG